VGNDEHFCRFISPGWGIDSSSFEVRKEEELRVKKGRWGIRAGTLA